MNMAVPKVKFKKMDIEDNLDCLVWYSNPKNSKNSPLDFYKFTLELFPELKGKLSSGMNDEEVYMVLDEHVRPILKSLYDNSDDIIKFQRIWDEVNDDVMKSLERRLETKWDDGEIVCRIGLCPVCSRDILGKTFDINYGTKKDTIIETGIHELCHMLYFKKWMEMFPNYSEEEFDNPHIAWYLSEAMIDPLLNNDEFKKYTDENLMSYSVFYETYIDGKSIVEILRTYVEKYSIEEAIKKGYELFKDNESLIRNS